MMMSGFFMPRFIMRLRVERPWSVAPNSRMDRLRATYQRGGDRAHWPGRHLGHGLRSPARASTERRV